MLDRTLDDPRLLIGGHWRATAETLPVEDPSTGEVFGALARGGASDVDAAVEAAGRALRSD